MYNTFTTNICYTLLLLLQYGLCSTAAYTTTFSAGNGHWEGFGHMTRMFAL